MKRIIFVLLAVLVTSAAIWSAGASAGDTGFDGRFAAASAKGESGTYNFDKAHSFIGFKIKHNGLIEVPGYFRDFTGAVNYNADDVARSSVEFTAKATSIDTGVVPRDNHLRSKDFFEVEKFPELTFKSTKVEKKGKWWLLTGDLTIKGVTKQVTFPFNITGFLPPGERSGSRMGLTAETVINRRDFGVNYGGDLPGGVPVLSNEVTVVLQIEAVVKKEMPAAKPAS